jgi:hypothetical protein
MSLKTNDTLTEKANAAFRQAAAKAIERARQTGTPVIVWEEGQVIERTCEELDRPPKGGRWKAEGGRKRERRQAKE